jgi:mutator protein MutT
VNAERAVRVGIAIVEHQGRYLVGTRPADADLPGKAEFPGGKCEAGESPEHAAVRECLEETGLEVEPIRLLQQREFTYEHATVELHFWLCCPLGDPSEPENGFRWFACDELERERFPEANDEILALIRSKSPFLDDRE